MKRLDALDSITFGPQDRRSIVYAKARAVIEKTTADRHQRREMKVMVIEVLGGRRMMPKAQKYSNSLFHSVHFPDGTKARY